MPVPHRPPRPRRHRPGLAAMSTLAAGSLLLAGCSAAPAAAPAAGPTDELAQQYAAYVAMSDIEREAQLRTTTADLERQLVLASGLEAQLGGPAKADAAYAAVARTVVQRIDALKAAPGGFGKFGALARADEPVTLGGLLFGDIVVSALGAEAALSSTSGMKPGETDTRTTSEDKGPLTNSVTVSGGLASAAIDAAFATTVGGVSGTLRSKVSVNPCPDPAGKFSATVSMTASATSAGGRTGSNSTIDIAFDGQVDDDARLVGYDSTTRSQAAEFGGGSGTYADVTDRSTTRGTSLTGYSRTVNRTGGTVKAGFAAQWANMGMLMEVMMSNFVLKAAQQAWESGRCVTLVPTSTPVRRTGLAPSTPFTVVAAPRSTIDGSAVGGTITGALTGGSSLDPLGRKVPADATFAYVAPDKKDERAAVVLESRSKRGVAKATVDFDTWANNAWEISETQAPYAFAAIVCGSVRGPWKIAYTLKGFPELKGGGVISLTFPGDPSAPVTAPVTTSGPDKGRLDAVGLPGGVRFSSTATATLTPVDDQHYSLQIKDSGGSSTGFARDKQRSFAWPGSGYTLSVKSAYYACSP